MMDHISFSKLFALIATTSMLLCFAKAGYPGQNGTMFLRDRLPRSHNFVILTLNEVDKIKVPIPTGSVASYMSLLDFGEAEAESMSFSRKVRSWFPDGERTPRPSEDSRRPYLLKQVELTARSGPHRARCIFTRADAQLDGLGRSWPETNFAEIYFKTVLRKKTYVTEVWCVAEEELVVKILTDPLLLPPPQSPLSSSLSPSSPPFSSSVRLVPIVELSFQQPEPSDHKVYALTKLSSEDGRLPRIYRAAIFYDHLPRSHILCRPIIYDGWPSRPFYQGPPVSGELEGEPRQALDRGILVFAYYCDNWTSYDYYINFLYRTGWDPDWTSGDAAFKESIERLPQG